jgi:hypothetical protein
MFSITEDTVLGGTIYRKGLRMHHDIIQSATMLVDAARARKLELRLLGGIAVALHCPNSINPGRSYRDIDTYIPAKRQAEANALFSANGFVADKQFNLLNGDTRMLFFDPVHQRQVDVFVGEFRMCHPIPISTSSHPYTIAVAELLLTKLQIYQLNPKDAHDGCALLHELQIGTSPAQQTTRDRLAQLCGADWGLWRTFTLNLERCVAYANAHYDAQFVGVLQNEVAAVLNVLANAPKTLGYKMRAAVGEKVQWYELPEEVDRE